MPSRDDLTRLAQGNARLVAAARRELGAFIAMLPADPAAQRAAARDFFPALVRQYGEVGVALAAEWFEDVAPSGDARILLAEALPDEQLGRVLDWAERGDLARRLAQATQRLVLAPSRGTLRRSAFASGARFGRVPTKPNPCAFCVMLASRGFVYESEETAQHRGRGQEQDKYHDDCGCVATPLWPGEPMPDGHDPEAMFAAYQAARKEAGGETADILAAMRQMHDMR